MNFLWILRFLEIASQKVPQAYRKFTGYTLYIYTDFRGIPFLSNKISPGTFNYFNPLSEGFEDSSFFQMYKLKDAII